MEIFTNADAQAPARTIKLGSPEADPGTGFWKMLPK